MNKAWTMAAGLLAVWGCGSYVEPGFGLDGGIYAGTIGLLNGVTPACSQVSDPAFDACCDDTQIVTLTVTYDHSGYFVNGWPASIDTGGNLYWNETFTGPDGSCIDVANTTETLTSYNIYSYVVTTTQTCGSVSQTLQCAYSGQLYLQ